MDIPTLTSLQRRNLRSHAHHLHPLVMIGDAGLTPAVLAAIDLELTHHALIKVRAFSDDRGEREALLEAICKATGCAPVQHIGKLFVLFRQTADLAASQIDPNLSFSQAQQAQSRKVIAPVGAQLTKKQAAAARAAKTAGKTADKKSPRKLATSAKPARTGTGRSSGRQDFAPRKAIGVPETSAARRTHLSAADRRAAYATVTERAPRPTTKPGRVTKPRRAATLSKVASPAVAVRGRAAPSRKR
jgi:RNA-binding protein